MAEEVEAPKLYVCPHCVTPWNEPGACHACGHERVECKPGSDGDPRRRPLMTAQGEIKTRAPLWWLRFKNGWLAEAAERFARGQ